MNNEKESHHGTSTTFMSDELECRRGFAYIGRLKPEKRSPDEKDVSAPQEKTQEHARFSGQNGHKKRPKSAQPEKSKGSTQIDRKRRQVRAPILTRRLPKDRILRGRGAFADILAKGMSVSSGSVKLFFAPSAEPPETRIGFAVLRGIKNAAVRNRIKRCLREAFRHHQHEIPAKFGGLVLLYVGKTPRQSSEIHCTSVERDVQNVFKRLSRKE